MLVAFFLAVFTMLGMYYNMPTSIEGEIGTKNTIDMKELRDYVSDDVEEPEDAELEVIEDDNR